MALSPGTLLNQRYNIEQVIAVGGMSAVYAAQDTVLNIKVAVKENNQTAEQFIRQFRREAALLSHLNHPNLPRVTDHFAIPGIGQYLVMDFIDGQDLREIIANRGSLAESETIALGQAVCNALEYLHTRRPPIVHRDIKPGNVKVTAGGHVYLVDFGLAKLSQSGQSTTTGAQALTPGYAPPEQYGQGTEPRSDIYALGATLYACLTGKIPPDSLERAMGTARLTSIRELNPAISQQTASAVEKALNIRLEHRFQSAAEFCAALTGTQAPPVSDADLPSAIASPIEAPEEAPPAGAAQASQPIVPAEPPLPPAPANPSGSPQGKKHSLVPALLAALAVILGLGLFALWITFSKQKEQPVPTQAAQLVETATASQTQVETTPAASPTAFPQATLTPSLPPASTATPTLSPTFTPTTAATPLGGAPGEIAFSSNRGGTTQIWVVRSDGSDLRQVTRLPDGACEADWSPDGKRLVFVSPCLGRRESYPGASLFLINANGTGLVPLASIPGGDFDPAWSPDGQAIAFTSLRSGKEGIYLYNLRDNTVRRLSSPVNIERRPAWSPDGKSIAYETGRQGTRQIWVMNADGSNMHELSKLESGKATSPAWAPEKASTSGSSLIVYSQGNELPYLVGRVPNDPTASEARISEKNGIVDARYSNDGFWLAYTQIELHGATTVYLMMNNGGNQTAVAGSSGGDFHPSWRP